MTPLFRTLLAIMCLPVLTLPAYACVWDHDTLQQERAQFPSAIELITGKFLRHSKEFYEWRIKDRLQKLSRDPNNLAYYDDLGVAYQKTGQPEQAIETMLKKEKLKPGLYETAANLGTFYILDGNLETGLKYIDKALEINPHAHFDRERYQKWLVEYALIYEKDGRIKFPLRKWPREQPYTYSEDPNASFSEYLTHKLNLKHGLSLAESQKAVKAVLGMMRFADYDNPLLLDSLGDLLVFSHDRIYAGDQARRLAARAYLAASYKFKGKPEEQAYRELAGLSLAGQTKTPFWDDALELSELETEFNAERAEATIWYGKLRQQEIDWIRDGKNPEIEFDKLYKSEPETFDKNAVPLLGQIRIEPVIFWFCTLLIVIGTLIFGVILTKGKNQRHTNAPSVDKDAAQ